MDPVSTTSNNNDYREYFVVVGTVKKCAFLKIMHMKFKTTKKNEDAPMRDFLRSFDDVVSRNKEIVPLLAKTQVVHFQKFRRLGICFG